MVSSIAYGPVPSRRLGRSLGINNIPPKICSYSCIYCQLGRTSRMQVERSHFYEAAEIAEEVKAKIKQAEKRGEPVDYVTFVSDGEPTLDADLGREIELLKNQGVRVAVITNASLIWRQDVRQDLRKADWVSLKVDAVSQEIWRRVNRPHKSLKLEDILEGMLKFAKDFGGELATETMLIDGINDTSDTIRETMDFLAELKPNKAYLATPTRPPAESFVACASEHSLNTAYQVFSERLSGVEYLIGYEGNAFAFTGNAEQDLLSITAVHPMREEAVRELLKKADSRWEVVGELIENGSLMELEYQGKRFYIRRLSSPSASSAAY